MSELLKIAIPEIGVKEIRGKKHNRRIIDYAKESGFDWINDDETPWCSVFINWCAKKSKLKRTDQANARSWLLVGMPVEEPEPGDIVVFWRGSKTSWKGHVAIFMGYAIDKKRIYCLGGNQGNQVSITAYSSKQLLGYRRLSPSNIIKLSSRNLKKGSTGEAVRRLQDALKILGFKCGTSDGVFGPRTEQCVIELQSVSGFLDVNGVVNKETRAYIESKLMS